MSPHTRCHSMHMHPHRNSSFNYLVGAAPAHSGAARFLRSVLTEHVGLEGGAPRHAPRKPLSTRDSTPTPTQANKTQ